jgi:PBP1b-binding outer membrane lipoprotein LpoB
MLKKINFIILLITLIFSSCSPLIEECKSVGKKIKNTTIKIEPPRGCSGDEEL